MDRSRSEIEFELELRKSKGAERRRAKEEKEREEEDQEHTVTPKADLVGESKHDNQRQTSINNRANIEIKMIGDSMCLLMVLSSAIVEWHQFKIA